MTKANANAAANAQEQQAAQQQILRDLLALGKKNGRLTLKEISDALSHLELSSEDIDKVYETLETTLLSRRKWKRFRRKNWSIPLPWLRHSPLTIRSACI